MSKHGRFALPEPIGIRSTWPSHGNEGPYPRAEDPVGEQRI